MAEDKDYIDFGTINSIFSKLKSKFDLKVNKETGKGLSTNDYTAEDKTKLEGIAIGAEVNVQSDWNETDTSSDAYIVNKPTVQSVSYEQSLESGTKIGTITIDETSTDIYAPAPDEPTVVDVEQIVTEGTDIATITVNDTSTTIKAPTIPENVSEFVNDANYATEAWVEAKGYTTNVGTITGITMNGSSKGTSGVVDLGTILTEHQDISGKADAATTLSGYGITDAKIENGTITLGTNTITPVTDVSGKADITTTVTNVSYDTTSKKIQKTINGTTSDVVTLATVATTNSYNDLDHKLISDTSYLGGHSLLNHINDDNYIKVLQEDSTSGNSSIIINEVEQGYGALQFGVNTSVIATVSSLNAEIARAEGAETTLSGTINGVSSRVDAISDALSSKQNTLIPGNNITIDTDDIINAFSNKVGESSSSEESNYFFISEPVHIHSGGVGGYLNITNLTSGVSEIVSQCTIGTSGNNASSFLSFYNDNQVTLSASAAFVDSIINIKTSAGGPSTGTNKSIINIEAKSSNSNPSEVNITGDIVKVDGKLDTLDIEAADIKAGNIEASGSIKISDAGTLFVDTTDAENPKLKITIGSKTYIVTLTEEGA